VAVQARGTSFGELALVSPSDTRAATVVALEPVETLTIHRRDFEQLRREHPAVNAVLVKLLAAQVPLLSGQLLEALFVSADKRVLRRVLDLCDVYASGQGRCEIALTQDDIAGLAGTTRATVNKVLRALETDGLVSLGRGRLWVIDPGALATRSR
jgi:CRP-like cAMP-binding protein